MPKWIPLESNPEVLTRFSHALGLPSKYCLSEVFSPELLDIVPSPRYAVIFLFPLTLPEVEHSELSVRPTNEKGGKAPFFMKQTIANACGTIALLHAFCNNKKNALDITKGSFVDRYYDAVKDMDPTARGRYLEDCKDLDKVQEEFAKEGQSSVPGRNDDVDLHFVCFVESDGWLYELDGRKDKPTQYGKCNREDLLQKSFKVIQECFMKRDPTETKFSVLAVTPTEM